MTTLVSPYQLWVKDAVKAGLMQDPKKRRKPQTPNRDIHELMRAVNPEFLPLPMPLLRTLDDHRQALLVQALLSQPVGTPLTVSGDCSIEAAGRRVLTRQWIHGGVDALVADGLLAVAGSGRARTYTLTSRLGKRLTGGEWQVPEGEDIHTALRGLIKELDPRFIAVRPGLIGVTGSLERAMVLEVVAVHLCLNEMGTPDGHVPMSVRSEGGMSLHKLCGGIVSTDTLYAYLDAFVAKRWLSRRVRHIGPWGRPVREYCLDGRLARTLKRARDDRSGKRQKNVLNVFWPFVSSLVYGELSPFRPKVSALRTHYLFLKERKETKEIKEKRGGSDGPARNDRSEALRALPVRSEPEQQRPHEDEEGASLPEVGGQDPQSAMPDSDAQMPVSPPPEVAVGQACGVTTAGLCGGVHESAGEVPEVAVDETAVPAAQGVDDTVSPDAGERARPTQAELAAQLEAFEALQAGGRFQADVPPSLREGTNFAARDGIWRFPAVQGLLERPQTPVAFEGTLRDLLGALKRVPKARRAAEVRVQIEALDSTLHFLPRWLSETPRGADWKRAARWQRLRREEIELAVEVVPKFFKRKGADGKKRSPASTLALLLDLLCGRAEGSRHDGVAPTPSVDPIQHQAEAARRAEELARSEAEVVAEQVAEEAALLAAAPHEQWEQSRATLTVLTKGVLDTGTFNRLEECCRAGIVSAAQLVRELIPLQRKRERIQAHLAPLLG